jgi:hypothetical protein
MHSILSSLFTQDSIDLGKKMLGRACISGRLNAKVPKAKEEGLDIEAFGFDIWALSFDISIKAVILQNLTRYAG